MSAPIDYQTIEQDGKPAFAVVPFEQFQKLLSLADDDEALIPHDVVKATAIGNDSMIKAWREHLGMTQADLADKAGMSQPAIAQLEKGIRTIRHSTLEKLAGAMNIEVHQLKEI